VAKKASTKKRAADGLDSMVWALLFGVVGITQL
jgi:hypothetical protein